MQFSFGSGVLWGIRSDVANSTPIRVGVLQDCQVDFSGDIKELFGQYQFPVDVARGKNKITGKCKFAEISAGAFNSLYFGQTLNTGQTLVGFNEAQTVGAVVTGTTNGTTAAGNPTLHFASTPAGVTVGASIADGTSPAVIPAGTYVLSKTGTTVTMSQNAAGAGVGGTDTINFGPIATVSNTATFVTDLGVRYSSTGLPLTLVAGAPAAGQYTVAPGGIYSFNSADAAAAVLIDYTYTATSGFTIVGTNGLMGAIPKFKAVFNDQYGGNQLTLILYSCVSGKLAIPTKLDDYTINEFDFSAFANSAGQVFQLSASLD